MHTDCAVCLHVMRPHRSLEHKQRLGQVSQNGSTQFFVDYDKVCFIELVTT